MALEFKLPDLGEGLKEGTLVNWLVKEGDAVAKDQTVAEVETDKATTPLPIPYAGKVMKLHYKPGEVIPVGKTIITIEGEAAPAIAQTKGATSQKAAPAKAAAPAKNTPAPAKTVANLTPAQPTPAPVPVPAPAPSKAIAVVPQKTLPAAAAVMNPSTILAAPATRKLAREKGVDLRLVRGTGPGGRITQEDVQSFRAGGGRTDDLIAPISSGEGAIAFQRPRLPDFSSHGDVERKPASPIRKRIVQAMSISSQVTAAVTYMDEVDVTALEQFRQEAKDATKARGVKLTTLALIAKACAAALQRFPDFNASYDDDREEVVYKKYYHIGIAVDSPQGLLVPVVRNCDTRPVAEIASEIVSIAEAARTGKITREQMRGGSFTITNIGSIGGLGFTPVINWPEVAILGVGRTQERLAFDKDQKIVARKMLPLCLSFDHRLIDGAAAAHFVNAIKEYLENPLLLLLDA